MATQDNFNALNAVVPASPSNTGAPCTGVSTERPASRSHDAYAPSPATSGRGARGDTLPTSNTEGTDTANTRCQHLKSSLKLLQQFVRILVSQRLVRAQQFYARGRLPEAVLSHSVLVRGAFQRKALSLLILQTLCGLAGASVVAVLDSLCPAPGALLGSSSLITVCSFTIASLERFMYPWNYITLATLTLFGGVSIGLMTKKVRIMHEFTCGSTPAVQELQLVFLAAYAVALLIATLLVILASRRHTMRMSIAACMAVIVTNVMLCAIWAQTRFCHIGWLCGITVILSASVLWVGFDMDRLLSKLMIDEYVLPALLVWGDLFIILIMGCFVALFYILVVGEVQGEKWACLCDCWFEDPPEVVPDAPPSVDPAQNNPNSMSSPAPAHVVPEQARMAWAEN